MAGRIMTRRWNDRDTGDAATRVLVCRYRPRGVRREEETWDEWRPELGPSRQLHAAFYGKGGQPAIDFAAYRVRYLEELRRDPGRFHLRALAGRIASGEDVVLLCSSACTDEARCHRTLLRALLADLVDAV